MRVSDITRMAVFVALAAVCSVVENWIPPLFFLAPGAKIGLGNIIVLLAIVTMGYWQAGVVLLFKCLFGALFGGNWFGLVYSLSGGFASYVFMCLMYRFLYRRVSVVAISVVSAVIHNTVQTFVATLVVQQVNYFIMLPFLLIASVIAGLVVGFSVYLVVRFVPLRVLIGRNHGYSVRH